MSSVPSRQIMHQATHVSVCDPHRHAHVQEVVRHVPSLSHAVEGQRSARNTQFTTARGKAYLEHRFLGFQIPHVQVVFSAANSEGGAIVADTSHADGLANRDLGHTRRDALGNGPVQRTQ